MQDFCLNNCVAWFLYDFWAIYLKTYQILQMAEDTLDYDGF